MTRPTKSERLKSILEATRGFHAELDHSTHSDRAQVITVGAFLDSMLEQLLFFGLAEGGWKRDLFEGQGPLATFSARIDMACAMGLLPESLRRDLHLIRKLRNHFAHRVVGGSLLENPAKQYIEATSVHGFVVGTAVSQGRRPDIRKDFRDSVHVLVGFLQGCVERARTPEKMPNIPLPVTPPPLARTRTRH